VPSIDLDGDKAREGLLGLVVALVEVIHEALTAQAIRRMDAGTLAPEHVERVGRALAELARVLDDFKREQGLTSAVAAIREQLDGVADRLLGLPQGPVQTRW
jgi:hypothetical protein